MFKRVDCPSFIYPRLSQIIQLNSLNFVDFEVSVYNNYYNCTKSEHSKMEIYLVVFLMLAAGAGASKPGKFLSNYISAFIHDFFVFLLLELLNA